MGSVLINYLKVLLHRAIQRKDLHASHTAIQIDEDVLQGFS